MYVMRSSGVIVAHRGNHGKPDLFSHLFHGSVMSAGNLQQSSIGIDLLFLHGITPIAF